MPTFRGDGAEAASTARLDAPLAPALPGPRLHALSVDVEEYFHAVALSGAVEPQQWAAMPARVERAFYKVLDLLAEAEARATCFFLGWVAARYPALVRAALAAGHEIGCHGQNHQLVSRLSQREFRDDVGRAQRHLEDLTGRAILGYRAPSFSITFKTPWAYPVLAELGFAYSSSVHPIHHDFADNAGAPRRAHRVFGGLLELPIATVTTPLGTLPMAGGAYWRILPLSYCRWALRRWESETDQPAIAYFHPWEMDPEQPRLAVGWRSALRHYTGQGRFEKKLRCLLAGQRFAPLAELFAPQIELSPRKERRAA